jgi:ABC-type glycerol-3-phosphate transport system substrate-binding protein
MKKTLLAALLAAAVLAACGGGGYDNPPPPPATSEVPASASQSPAGFIAYLQLLVASVADMLEPVDTSGVVPPADDTGEPTKVD